MNLGGSESIVIDIFLIWITDWTFRIYKEYRLLEQSKAYFVACIMVSFVYLVTIIKSLIK